MPAILSSPVHASSPDKPAFISCTTCRSRKVKCTGERPACANCVRRDETCSYDAVVRRRGPDRLPGARLKYRDDAGSVVAVSAVAGTRAGAHDVSGAKRADRGAPFPLYSPPGRPAEAREQVWAQLLDDFDPDPAVAVRLIAERCARFFDDAFAWHSFLCQTVFYHRLHADGARAPHLVLAVLAHVTFLEQGRNSKRGQARALQHATDARALVGHQLVAGSKCPTLAQAALLLATLEAYPSVWYSLPRSSAAVIYADDCVRACLPVRLDAEHAALHADIVSLPRPAPGDFARLEVVAAGSGDASNAEGASSAGNAGSAPRGRATRGRAVTGRNGAPRVRAWSTNPAWPAGGDLAALLKEEMRRTCWCASQISGSVSIWRKLGRKPLLRLAGSDPTRYALLFPGEASFHELGEYELGKVSVWALCHRAISLWHLVSSRTVSADDRARVLEQARAIEADAERYATDSKLSNYAWQAHDWALAVRRQLIGIDPARVTLWFQWQTRVLASIAVNKPGVPSPAERPLHGWWYLLQAYSAVELSAIDPALSGMAETVLDYSYHALDEIMKAWPCPPLEQLVVGLRKRHLQFRQRVGPAAHA